MKVQMLALAAMAVVFMCAADSSVAQRYGAEATLRFCVKEQDGKPLAGVHVKATEGASFDVVTDADGVATASGIMRERIRYSVGWVERRLRPCERTAVREDDGRRPAVGLGPSD